MVIPLLVYLIFFVVKSYQHELPKELQKCNRTSPDFNDCMVKSITNGIKYFEKGSKEFGIPSLSPLKISKLEIPAQPGHGVVLNQKYENLEFYNLRNSIVKSFKMNPDENHCSWEMTIFTDHIRMAADFKLTGQLLVVPINGDGKCNVTLDGMINKHTVDCERYQKKGKTYLRFKNYKLDMSVEKCKFDFPNVIKGNPELATQLQKTIDENSLEIFNDVKHGFEELMAQIHQSATNKIFSKIPEDELFVK